MFKEYQIEKNFGAFEEVKWGERNNYTNQLYNRGEERLNEAQQRPAFARFSRSRLGNWTIVWLQYAYLRVQAEKQ